MNTPETGLVRFLPLASIRPAPQNDLIYKPVDPDDPDVLALADSIRKEGVLVPLEVTLDHVILSGHRRRVAAMLAGLDEVPCRFKDILSTDPGFLPLLREYNRQRVKTADEVVREEVLAADPEEAHRVLVEHRKKRARVEAETIAIEGVKRRWKISKAKRPLMEAVLRVIEERKDFWALTLRAIHYALLNDPPLRHASKPNSTYQNDRNPYKDLSDLLLRARLEELVPWEAIDDPTRLVTAWNFFRSVAPFVRQELDGFLKGYYRDLQQSQPNHIEIIGEKNTVQSIIDPVAGYYGIPYTIGRGYASGTPRKKMAERFRLSGKEYLILLVLCDFDPEGEDIGHSFARSMRDDFGIENIRPLKVALTAVQVKALKLPPKLKAKEDSSR
jgi:hypothetical protein